MLRNLSISYKLAISPLISPTDFGIFLAFVIADTYAGLSQQFRV